MILYHVFPVENVELLFFVFRDLLRDKFDLALLLDERIPNGVHPEEFAKVFAFSFNIFHKCVYLSTSTMVSKKNKYVRK